MVPVESDWIWGVLNGVLMVAVGSFGYMWKRLESRVLALETESAKHKDVSILREDIRMLATKFDMSSERAEERHARLLELLLNKIAAT